MLLRVCDLYKTYSRGRLGRDHQRALNGIDLCLEDGVRLALVGASASGKSTLAKCVAGWEMPDRGEIALAANARVQLIPQNAGDSLNPRFTAAQIVEEPFRIRGIEPGTRAGAWMERVHLPGNRNHDRPANFSGGERVRLAIARALAATDPDHSALLIFDESFSSLDVPLQEQLLDLLKDLQSSFPLTYLLIAHDLSFAARFAGEIAVMHNGQVVERGPSSQVTTNPQSESGRQLVAAAAI
jgi:ABC-type dipeptide/oligopeptide/nickel transport system ATPase subunit